MVSARCITTVKDSLSKLGFYSVTVILGEADIREDISTDRMSRIKAVLLDSGFALLEDKKNILVEKLKTSIIQIVYYAEEPLIENLSVFLSRTLRYDYTYMSNLFSESLGITIERFFICHKIERVKELLMYNELTLTEISFKMHYSSVAHLATQFKKITGQTTSQFKQQGDKTRTPIENVCS
jgi:AraC-like DNA-binding protein